MRFSKGIRALPLLCLLVSCVNGDGKTKIDPGIYDKETMAAVLMEMHLIEAAYRSGAINPGIQQAGRKVQQKALERLGTDTLQFDESFAYYSAHSDQLEEVYDLVNIELTKAKLENIETKPQK